jgi:tubulin polyglutamylase TTLL2
MASSSPPKSTRAGGSSSTGGPPYNYSVQAGNGSELVNRALARRPWWRVTPEKAEFHFWWGSNGQHFDWEAWHSRPPGAPRQLVNRLKGNAGISVKDRLCLNLRKYAKAAKLEQPLTPLSFVLNGPPEGETELPSNYELMAFRGAVVAHKAKRETMWICKPAKLNRGRGIQVFQSGKQVEKFLASKSWKNPWVVQKYIENPLLLGGRKFDIRLLVLVTPPSFAVAAISQKVYMYRDSYVRTSSVEYNPAHEFTKDTSMHLVNDAVQSKFETCEPPPPNSAAQQRRAGSAR